MIVTFKSNDSDAVVEVTLEDPASVGEIISPFIGFLRAAGFCEEGVYNRLRELVKEHDEANVEVDE